MLRFWYSVWRPKVKLFDIFDLYEQEQTRLWKELGPVFLRWREEANLTQKMVAELVGTTDVTIHNVESGVGRGACSIETLGRIAAVLTMPEKELLKVLKENDR